MAVSAGGPDRPAADEAEAAEYLGGALDEVAVFALAHTPRRYAPLTDTEIRNLKASVAGTLPGLLSEQVRELLRRNAAAVELVMSEQLLANANRKQAVPAALSNRIFSRTRPAARVAASRTRSIVRWRYVWGLPAAAALAVAFSFYGINRSASPNFEIAALDDEEILAQPGGKTRGIVVEFRKHQGSGRAGLCRDGPSESFPGRLLRQGSARQGRKRKPDLVAAFLGRPSGGKSTIPD